MLNEDYAGANSDLENVPAVFTDLIGKPGLRFALATTDPSGAPTSGITRPRPPVASFGVAARMKTAAPRGPRRDACSSLAKRSHFNPDRSS